MFRVKTNVVHEIPIDTFKTEKWKEFLTTFPFKGFA
jgi:hypothetical protein